MDQKRIKELLRKVKKGEVSVDAAVSRLRDFPFEDIDVACIDHHRSIRRGASEVIFGEGKEVEDILAIMDRMIAQEENILVTRLSLEKAGKIKKKYRDPYRNICSYLWKNNFNYRRVRQGFNSKKSNRVIACWLSTFTRIQMA